MASAKLANNRVSNNRMKIVILYPRDP